MRHMKGVIPVPKEVIRCFTPHENVTVSWGESGFAQVGVTLGSKFVFLEPDDEGKYEKYDSLFVTLTERAQFDQLLRAIRRARDAVCERDEP